MLYTLPPSQTTALIAQETTSAMVRSMSTSRSAAGGKVSTADHKQCLKEHLELCIPKGKSHSERDISHTNWTSWNRTDPTIHNTQLMDSSQLSPVQRLLYPESLLPMSSVTERTQRKYQEQVAKLSQDLSGLSETTAKQFKKCLYTLSDRRKALPTLNNLGSQLGKAYHARYKETLPARTTQTDVNFSVRHNPHHCTKLSTVSAENYSELMPSLRAQQHCKLLSPEFIHSLDLKHDSTFLVRFLDSYLKERDIDYFCHELNGFHPACHQHSVYLDDLLTGIPISKIKTGRTYQMLVLAVLADTVKLDQNAFVELARSGLLDKLLHQPPAPLIQTVDSPDGSREESAVALTENFYTSPQNLFYDLGSLSDHQALEHVRQHGSPEQKKQLMAIVTGYTAEELTKINPTAIPSQLLESSHNLYALSLVVTAAQYQFSTAAETKSVEQRNAAKKDTIHLGDHSINIPTWSPKTVEQQNFAKLILKARKKPPESVLSIACGKGSCLASCMEAYKNNRHPWKLTGYDISPISLREAKRFVKPGMNVDLQMKLRDCADMDPEAEPHHDLIIMRAPDPFSSGYKEEVKAIWKQIFVNAQRMLKPGGSLVMTHFYKDEHEFFLPLAKDALVDVVASGKNPLFDSVTYTHSKTGDKVGRDLYYTILKAKASK